MIQSSSLCHPRISRQPQQLRIKAVRPSVSPSPPPLQLRDQCRQRRTMFTPSPASTSASSSSNEDSGHVLRSSSSVYHLGPSSSASAYLGPSAASGRTAAYRRRSLQSLNTLGSSAFVSVAIGICRYLRRQNYVEYEIMVSWGLETPPCLSASPPDLG